MSIVETEVDGVPTLFAERLDGHTTGGLVFRVGWADENLAVRGLTHLVAHLALAGSVPDVHLHCDTHASTTHFRAQGTGATVAATLGGICATLGALPAHLLEEEKETIEAEDEGRRRTLRLDALYRYGARGHGLVAYPETGLPAIGPELAQIWAAEAFTRGNAVLWLTGDRIPDGLHLPLPEGPHQEPPAVGEPAVPLPAWYRNPVPDLLTATGVVPRSAAGAVFTHLLEQRLQAELSGADPRSWTAGATYAERDATSALVTVTADSRPGERAGVTGGFVDALARLRFGRLSREDVAAAAAEAAAEVGGSAADHETVAARAVARVLGAPYDAPDARTAALAAVGPDDVRACAEAFAATALAGVDERGLDWAGFSAAPVSSTRAVDGVRFPGLAGHDGTLVVAPDGVSELGGGTVSTVLFDDVALMTSYGDGGRHLVGPDGFQVDVEPTLYGVDDATLARIDAAVDLARVVRRAPRHPEDLPVSAPEPDPVAALPARLPPPSAPTEARPPRWRGRLPGRPARPRFPARGRGAD